MWYVLASFATPHHEAAADAHHPVLHTRDAGGSPCIDQPRQRPCLVEGVDVGTEEPPNPPPFGSPEGQAGWRQNGARVKPPGDAPRLGRWHEEVQAGERAARTGHPRKLGQRSRRVVHVSQQIGEADSVERRAWKGKVFGSPDLKPNAMVEAR